MSRTQTTIAIALIVCIACVANAGVMIQPSQLPATARKAAAAEISKARKQFPRTFLAVKALREQLPELDRNKRGRLLSLSKILKSLGRKGVPAMLDELAFAGKGKGSLSASAWDGWRVSLLEAVGSLRDARSAAVLSASFKHANAGEFLVTRAAAQALGRLGDLKYAPELLAHVRGSSEKRVAVISALGDFRRTTIARELASLVDRPEADKTVALLLKALGRIGNVWAWRTKIISKTGEGAAVREIAAEAAFKAFVKHAKNDWLRDRAMKAILVISAPSTSQRIIQLKSQHPELHKATALLARRFATSKLR